MIRTCDLLSLQAKLKVKRLQLSFVRILHALGGSDNQNLVCKLILTSCRPFLLYLILNDVDIDSQYVSAKNQIILSLSYS